MLEMKITITAPDLAAAIVSLANALESKGQATSTTAQTKPAVNPTDQPATPTPTVNHTVESVAQAPAAPVVPTSAPTYTLEMIAAAGSSLIDAGKLDALMSLLGKYGVDSLTNLAPEHYGTIAMELRALGARL